MADTTEVDRSPGSVVSLADQDLFRIHFDHLPRPAYIWRREGRDFVLIAYNRAAAEVPYSRAASLVGKPVSELQSGDKHDLRADFEHCARHRTVVRREVEHRYIATGTLRNVEITIVPLTADIVVLHTDDVTERHRTEQALRDSEQKYRTIVETVQEGIIAANLDSVVTYANRRMGEMLGYSPDEMIGRRSYDFIVPEQHEEARRIREEFCRGERRMADYRLRHRSGNEVWVSSTASPLLDESGQMMGLIYMAVDVTERRRAEQALRESERRMRALLDANPDMIVRVKRDGTYLDVHSADTSVNSFLPVEMRRFVGRNVREFFDAEFVRQHERHRHAALATGRVQRWDYVVKDRVGNTRHMEARFVKSGEDEVVVTVRDFTDRARLEREVIASGERERTRIGQDLHDGLAQLLIGVKLMLSALRDKLAAARSPLRDDAERAVELVSRAIAQTSELAHGLSPIPKRGRLSDALRQLARESEQLLGVPCEVAGANAPESLSETTAMHLYRIAQEAITNAVKHAKPTRIEIACDCSDGRLELTVTDDGTGIAEGACERGGLGLQIMSYRARTIGGELAVAPRPEGGTLVSCRAPLQPPGAEALRHRAPPRAGA